MKGKLQCNTWEELVDKLEDEESLEKAFKVWLKENDWIVHRQVVDDSTRNWKTPRKADLLIKGNETPWIGKVMVEITKLECLRCGHKWYPRFPQKPRICPYCKSPYWDKERKKKR